MTPSFHGKTFINVATFSKVRRYSDEKDMKHPLFQKSNWVTIATHFRGYRNMSHAPICKTFYVLRNIMLYLMLKFVIKDQVGSRIM